MEKIWKTDVDLDWLNNKNRFCSKALGIEFTSFGDDYLEAKMPVDERTHQPTGILHGGASCVLAETLGSVAANLTLDMSKYRAFGLEINASHLRMAKEGFVYAKATPIRIGKSMQVWDIKIRNEENKEVCVSRLTLSIASLDKLNK
jgi:1,4-dihydroxy-2-naphthoyl-CoA hydrolase